MMANFFLLQEISVSGWSWSGRMSFCSSLIILLLSPLALEAELALLAGRARVLG